MKIWEAKDPEQIAHATPARGQYLAVVHFVREIGDDLDVLGLSKPDPAAFATQLAKELQQCCADLGLPAGMFQVMRVEAPE